MKIIPSYVNELQYKINQLSQENNKLSALLDYVAMMNDIDLVDDSATTNEGDDSNEQLVE